MANRKLGINIFVALFGILLFLTIVNGFHQQPQCSWHDSISLRCYVEPGHNLIVEESVAGRGPEHSKSLWVQCAGDRAHSSQSHYLANSNNGYVLSDGVFMSVKNLLDLKFEHCQISGITPGAFDYFPHLQNFTLHSGTSTTSLNSNWPMPSSGSSTGISSGLSIKDAFRSLHKLHRLDLATTSLVIPNDFLCLLPNSLAHLNLSSTNLRDLRSTISPSDPTTISHCGSHIQLLDLSYNYVSLLSPASFSSMTKLEHLLLNYNTITTIAERALLGLTSLKRLSLIGNYIKSLAPEFFKDCRYLQEILLQNNSLSIIAPGLFTNLEYLYHLDLSFNELTSDWINGDTFRGLRSLNYLSLSHNQLTRIDSSLFRDLGNLEVLILSHNSLKQISSNICSGPHSYASLKFLALDNNKIESITHDSFKNCTRIEDLNLSGNRLTSVPACLEPLHLLRYIDLGENNITSINNVSYQKLYNLNGLRLTDNAIRDIDLDSFRYLTSLKIVNLAKNNITAILPGTFDFNPNLQALRLDSNHLTNLSQVVENVKNLLWLSLNENELTQFSYEELPGKLQWIELRGNQIESIYGSIESSRITKLDLSDNRLTEISSSSLPDSLVQLSLRNNSISKIQPYTFLLKENVSLIDLSHNKLQNLDQNALRLHSASASEHSAFLGKRTHPAEVLLSGNEFICDCSMQWLQDIHQFYQDTRYPQIIDEIKCSPQPYAPGSSVQAAAMTNYIFLCKYESHCAPSCHCCGFNCDCELQCPDSCSCYNDQSWTINIVDCSNAQYKNIPAKIPVDLTELRLDGNFLPIVESNSFFQHKFLKSLYLNSSQVEFIQNKSFHGLSQLTSLYLDNNFLEKLEGFEFAHLVNLEELYLQQNSLFWIANGTFAGLNRLRVLWLHQNNFVSLHIWESFSTLNIRRLSSLTLSGSDYSCECEFYTEFKNWLIEFSMKVSDVEKIHCVDTNAASTSYSTGGKGSKSELLVVKLLDDYNPKCSSATGTGLSYNPGNEDVAASNGRSNEISSSNTNLSVLEPSSSTNSDSWSELIVPLIAGVIGLILLILVLIMLSMYWRDSLQIWFHANCGLRLHVEPNEDKLFDAFISYSSKDEAWVRQVLASELERHSPPYRLCLRYRDIPIPGNTGASYVADALVSAFEASRRTILVLSHHFLKGEWNRIEVKSAHAQLLKDRSNKVIILLLGDLPPNIDPEIRLFLKTHKKDTISCDDKRFWDKLHFCLPDVKMKVPLGPRGGIASQATASSSSTSSTQYLHSRTNSSSNGSCANVGAGTGNYASAASHHHAYSTIGSAAGHYQPHTHLAIPTSMANNLTTSTTASSHSNNMNYSPSNMIISPHCNSNSFLGGNNRSRHVAIHI